MDEAGGKRCSSSVAQLDIHRWISEDLWLHFSLLNGGREPGVVHVCGELADTAFQLGNELSQFQPSELVSVLLHNTVGVDTDQFRNDHRVIVDRAGLLQKTYIQFWHGKPDLGVYELDIGLSYYPPKHAVHIHTVSFGKGMSNQERGQGLMSQTFKNIVDIIRDNYSGAQVTALALADPSAHWFRKYFEGRRLTSDIERSALREYVSVEDEHLDRLMIGKIRTVQ